MAVAGGYALEWKVYRHDRLPHLEQALVAAGYAAGDPETVLALELGNVAWDRFESRPVDVRAVRDEAGLADVAHVARAVGRHDVDDEIAELGASLRERPDSLSVYVAYADGQPVASGRVHYGQHPAVAELAGGRTIATHRNKGYFTSVVSARLREAAACGCHFVFVDALPTSEPILRNLGFYRRDDHPTLHLRRAGGSDDPVGPVVRTDSEGRRGEPWRRRERRMFPPHD
jgi:hypothetical protein